MANFQFRLQALLEQRMDRLKKAKEELAGYEKQLVAEQRVMGELEEEVSQAEELYRRKRMERVSLGPGGGGSLAARSIHLRGLKMNVQAAQAGVLSQQIFVDDAKDAVDEAKAKAKTQQRDVDVIEKYRQKAEAKYLREEAYREELEQDEIGNVMHLASTRHRGSEAAASSGQQNRRTK